MATIQGDNVLVRHQQIVVNENTWHMSNYYYTLHDSDGRVSVLLNAVFRRPRSFWRRVGSRIMMHAGIAGENPAEESRVITTLMSSDVSVNGLDLPLYLENRVATYSIQRVIHVINSAANQIGIEAQISPTWRHYHEGDEEVITDVERQRFIRRYNQAVTDNEEEQLLRRAIQLERDQMNNDNRFQRVNRARRELEQIEEEDDMSDPELQISSAESSRSPSPDSDESGFVSEDLESFEEELMNLVEPEDPEYERGVHLPDHQVQRMFREIEGDRSFWIPTPDDEEDSSFAGNSYTKINGNGNRVEVEQGANGASLAIPMQCQGTTTEAIASTGAKPSNQQTYQASECGKAAGASPRPQSFYKEPIPGKVLGSSATLNDPNVEGGPGPSDRIMATTHGNAIIQSQSALPWNGGYKSGTGDPPNPCTDHAVRPGPSVERPFQIPNAVWNQATEAYQMVSVFGVLAALQTSNSRSANVFRKVMTNHTYFRCGFDVEVMVNPSMFHQGILIVYASPLTQPTGVNRQSSTLYVHQFLNLRTNNAVKLSLPFTGPVPLIDSWNEMWNISMMVIAPLQATDGTPQALIIKTVVSPTDVEFYGLRQQEEVDFAHWKIRSLPGAAAFGNCITDQEIPVLNSSPESDSSDWIPGRVHDFLEIARTPGFFSTSSLSNPTFNWKFGDDTGAKLLSIPISPSVFITSPIGLVSMLFAQWRGAINMIFMFGGTANHFGRLCVAFTPYTHNEPVLMDDAMQGTYTIWDVGLNAGLDFTIPYMSRTSWRTTNKKVALLPGPTNPGHAEEEVIMGWLTVWVYTPLIGPSQAVVPTQVNVAVMVGGGESYQLRLPQFPNVMNLFAAGDEVAISSQKSVVKSKEKSDKSGGKSAGKVMHDSETSISVPETGDPQKEESLPGAIESLIADQPLDTQLAQYFGQYRPWYVDQDYLFEVKGPFVWTLNSNISEANLTLIQQAMKSFTLVKSDMNIRFTIYNQSTGVLTIRMILLPNGTTVETGGYAWSEMANFGCVEVHVQPGIQVICLNVPYTSNQCALETTPVNIEVTLGGTKMANPLTQNGWGAIQICEMSNNAFLLSMDVKHMNFKAWMPRPLEFSVPSTTLEEEMIRMRRRRRPKPKPVGLPFVEEESSEFAMMKCMKEASRLGEMITPELVTDVLQKVDRATEVVEKATTSMENVASKENMEVLEKIASSAKECADSLGGFTDTLKKTVDKETIERVCASTDGLAAQLGKITDMLNGRTDNPLQAKIMRWAIKILGALVVLITSPKVTTLVGVAMMFAADMDGVFTKNNPLYAMYIWIRQKLGYTHHDETEEKDCLVLTDMALNEEYFAAPPMKKFNEICTALRNCDWLVGKALLILEWLLNKIGKSIGDTSHLEIAKHHKEIVNLYTQSENLKTPDCHNKKQIKEVMVECERWLHTSAKAKNHSVQTLMVRALANCASADAYLERVKHTPRVEPVVIYLYGSPGCGKSVTSLYITALIAKAMGFSKEEAKNHVYSPSSTSEFFDQYTGQEIHAIDDMGQSPDCAEWKSFVNMVSTTSFSPPMADLNAKGINYKAKVIIISSNFASPPTAAAREPEALNRRLFFKVKVEPREEYLRRQGDNFVLDVSKAKQAGPGGPGDMPLLDGKAIKLTRINTSTTSNDMGSVRDLVNAAMFELNRRETLMDDPYDSVYAGRIYLRKDGEIFQCDYTCEHGFGPTDCEECVEHQWCGGGQTDADEGMTMTKVPVSIRSRNCDTGVEEALRDMRNTSKWDKAVALIPIVSVVAMIVTTVCILVGTVSDLSNKHIRKRTPSPVFDSDSDCEELAAAYNGMKGKAKKAKQRQTSKSKSKYASGKNLTPVSIFSKVEKQCYTVEYFTPAEPECALLTSLNLYGRVYCLNKHAFVKYSHIRLRGEVFDKKDLATVEMGDVMLSIFPTFQEGKSLLHLLKDEEPTGRCMIVVRNSVCDQVITTGPVEMKEKVTIIDGGQQYTFRQTVRTHFKAFFGVCGSPVITVSQHNPGIAGIMFSIVGKWGGNAEWFSKSKVAAAIEKLNNVFAAMIIPKSKPAFVTHIPRKTTLEKSPAYGAFEIKHEPAVLSTYDPRFEGDDLDDVVFEKYKCGDITTPWPNLEAAFDLYFSGLKLPKRKFAPLTLHDAINGIEGLDGIDMGQSPGYPFVSQGRSRRSFFTFMEDKWYATDELKSLVEKAMEDPDEFPYSTFLKDEKRPLEKVRAGKTRLVEGASLPVILAGRMLFGRFFAWMHMNVGENGCAVGCDPDVHWTEFCDKFISCNAVYGLDYKAFDSTIPTVCFDLLAKKLKEIIGVRGISSYIHSIARSEHVYGSKAYTMIGGMPSGSVGTSIFNSIINVCCVLSACLNNPEFHVPGFKILAYGDDVIYSSMPDIPPSEIREFYTKHTNFTITNATKTEDIDEETDIFGVTFLKRSFVPDPDYCEWIHPVISDDVCESGSMWMRKGNFQEAITSLCYLKFHSGPKSYKEWCDKVDKKSRENGYNLTFLPFSYLQNRWLQMCALG